jgi:hypothetical protein
VANKGGIEVVAGFLRRTPLAESKRQRLRWATSCLWIMATDLTRILALASCDLIPVIRDIFQVRVPWPVILCAGAFSDEYLAHTHTNDTRHDTATDTTRMFDR